MTPLRKVLVVDDDPVVGRSFERVLSGKGYAVITARDGEEALRKLNAEAYDVVFTDIKMPGMSGLEVAERVKAKQPWLPVVVRRRWDGVQSIKKRAPVWQLKGPGEPSERSTHSFFTRGRAAGARRMPGTGTSDSSVWIEHKSGRPCKSARHAR